jgi:hypothetical protein
VQLLGDLYISSRRRFYSLEDLRSHCRWSRRSARLFTYITISLPEIPWLTIVSIHLSWQI